MFMNVESETFRKCVCHAVLAAHEAGQRHAQRVGAPHCQRSGSGYGRQCTDAGCG